MCRQLGAEPQAGENGYGIDKPIAPLLIATQQNAAH